MDDVYTNGDDTDDDNDHKNDSYTAAGAAPGASVPFSLFIYKIRFVKLRWNKIRCGGIP